MAVKHSEHDEELVTQLALKASRGDRDALTEFIRLTQDDVWNLLSHFAGVEAADDLTQETYLRVISALPRFAARGTARTWLLSIARRVWADSQRHQAAHPNPRSTDLTELDDVPESSDTTESAAWSEWIDTRTLIDALPEDRREALILTQILGYTYEEAAHILGCRVGTIRSRVARARKDLLEGR